MKEQDSRPNADVIECGPEDMTATLWQTRRRLAALALLASGAFILTPTNQVFDDEIPPPVMEHARLETPSAPHMNIRPGHQKLYFTSMGSFLKTTVGSGEDRQSTARQVKTEFDELHCRNSRLYGQVSIVLSNQKMLLIEDTALPFTSMSLDCLFDNQLTLMGTDLLTVAGAEPYQYVAHRKLSSE